MKRNLNNIFKPKKSISVKNPDAHSLWRFQPIRIKNLCFFILKQKTCYSIPVPRSSTEKWPVINKPNTHHALTVKWTEDKSSNKLKVSTKSMCYLGDFVTLVKQINSESDLILMSTFAGPSYFTVRSSVFIILIWDPCVFNLYNLCQTGSNYVRRRLHQCAFHFNLQITRTHFLLLQPSGRPVPAQIIILWKGPPKLCIECHLVPLWALLPKSPGPPASVKNWSSQ